MQNKPKLKLSKIIVSAFLNMTSVFRLKPSFFKNKPKQTQTKLLLPVDICRLYQIKKMTNEPNLKLSKNIVSVFLCMTYVDCLWAAASSNEPNSNPIQHGSAILYERNCTSLNMIVVNGNGVNRKMRFLRPRPSRSTPHLALRPKQARRGRHQRRQ